MKKNNKRVAKKNTKPIDITNNIDSPNTTHIRKILKPRSNNQINYIRNIAENTITFCQGLPGTGKTHIAVGMAIEYLLEKKIQKIVITRPVIEAGEKIGYLPGSAEEKLHPYLLPIIDEILHFISAAEYSSLKTNHKIEVVPLGLMRGRNFHNCFIVADECQNASYDQLKMLLTRIGMNSKMVLTGDIDQSDLPKHIQGGFITMIDRLNNLSNIGISKLEGNDIIRNPIIMDILNRLEGYEKS